MMPQIELTDDALFEGSRRWVVSHVTHLSNRTYAFWLELEMDVVHVYV